MERIGVVSECVLPEGGRQKNWSRPWKELKILRYEAKRETFRGMISLPVVPGSHRRMAVRVIADPGSESLSMLNIE